MFLYSFFPQAFSIYSASVPFQGLSLSLLSVFEKFARRSGDIISTMQCELDYSKVQRVAHRELFQNITGNTEKEE